MDRRKAISGLGVLVGGALLSPAALRANPFPETRPDAENKSVRKRKILSDRWKFLPDIKDIGEEERWFNQEYAKSNWGEVVVPKAWDTYEEALWEYEGVSWYMTVIDPQDFSDYKKIQLTFHRVMYYSKVWLNGEYVGENIGGYLPFDFDIARFLKAGTPNTLVVRVDNKPRLEWLPAAKQIEWIQYGGILQKVEVTGYADTYIDDLTIRTKLQQKGASAACLATVKNESAVAAKMELDITISGQGKDLKKSLPVELKAGETKQVTIDFDLADAKLWSPETPVLNYAKAEIRKGSVVVDDLHERFGIREVRTQGTSILLNGKPLLIKGVNRYDDYGRMGPVVPESVLREELALMKSAGINYIRVHYPQSPDLLSLYDEFGFVMMEEVPINWWGRNMEQSLDILKYAKPALSQMIRRDKNHPCLIIWSMSNESVTSSEVGIAVMRDLLTQAKSLDPTRLVTYVIDGNDDPLKHLALDKVDVICLNKYYGSLHGKICSHISDIEEFGYRPFVENMTKHRKDLPGKPMFLTEFGTQGIKNMHGDLYYSEEFQSAYIKRIWEGIHDVPGLSGGVLWCWADYYHRKYFVRYTTFGPYGLVTTERKPKKSLDTITRMYGGSRTVKS